MRMGSPVRAIGSVDAVVASERGGATTAIGSVGGWSHMLKLIGSYALAKLLGGGIFLAIIIYLLLTMLGR